MPFIKAKGFGGTVQGTGAHTYNIRARKEGTPAGNTRGENSVDLQTARANANNAARAPYSSILGGQNNEIEYRSDHATIGGGSGNEITWSPNAVLGGGLQNLIDSISPQSTICGGFGNIIAAQTPYSFIGGGRSNKVDSESDFATIVGGDQNLIDDDALYAFIGGGKANTIEDSSPYSTIVGGKDNKINNYSQYSFIGGGYNNVADYDYAMILGGANNKVDAAYGCAFGRRAKANHQGAFVWADSVDADFASIINNEFAIRASGGVRLGPGDARCVIQAEDAAPTDGDLFNGSVVMYIDEGGNNLKFRVKYTGGTLKTGTLAVI